MGRLQLTGDDRKGSEAVAGLELVSRPGQMAAFERHPTGNSRPVAVIAGFDNVAAMSSLKLSYTLDPADDISLLSIEAHSKSFSGIGSCWASQVDLQAFSERLELYPITEQDPITLSCGPNQLEGDDLICNLALRPADKLGNLVVEAEIADRNDSWSRVRLKFNTNYTDVARFRQAMAAMLAGNKAYAKLQGYG